MQGLVGLCDKYQRGALGATAQDSETMIKKVLHFFLHNGTFSWMDTISRLFKGFVIFHLNIILDHISLGGNVTNESWEVLNEITNIGPSGVRQMFKVYI